MNASVTPEFSRRIELRRLGSGAADYPIIASAEERDALARRFDLLALDRLEAEIRLQRGAGHSVRLDGVLRASVIQACVVTLEPVAAELAESFTMLFGPEEPGTRVIVPLEGEIVEPLNGDVIDIGEAVAQQLALLLDPYPRAPEARIETEAPGNTEPGC